MIWFGCVWKQWQQNLDWFPPTTGQLSFYFRSSWGAAVVLFYLPKLAPVASTWGKGEALPAQKEKPPPWTGSPI